MGYFGDESKGSTCPAKVSAFITVGLSIAFIIMGAAYLHKCPADPMIPIYEIVMGVLTILTTLYRLQLNKWNETSYYPWPLTALFVIMALGTLAWFIAGNVFIYRLYGHYNGEDEKAANYCDQEFYMFAFWCLNVNYILLGVLLLFYICMCCCCRK